MRAHTVGPPDPGGGVCFDLQWGGLHVHAHRVAGVTVGISYESLDADVRKCMLGELQRDIANGSLYMGKRLTEEGRDQWPDLLREAIANHDDNWLANELRTRQLVKAREERRRNGKVTFAKIPVTAPDTLAEGEFNRFYARGLCLDVLNTGGTEVEVYRGKAVSRARSQSVAMIGQVVPAVALLDDLRTSPGMDTALGLPPGPNSGLTVRRA